MTRVNQVSRMAQKMENELFASVSNEGRCKLWGSVSFRAKIRACRQV
jgi:hypothetical protein